VTEIETWLRDPYAIYAKHVLKLRPLDALDQEIGPLERGTALHKALEDFVRLYPGPLSDNALLDLMRIADDVFARMGVPKAALAVWRPRFLGAARWFVDYERGRRAGIARSHLEVKGKRIFTAPAGDFELRGVADRIDLLTYGGAAIIDYKTGAPPSRKQVEQLLSPQLPLEAAILAEGGFEGVEKCTADALIYLRLSGGAKPGEERSVGDDALAAEAVEKLMGRIAWFDEEMTPYRSRVRPWRADIAGDYDHLARVREWSPSGWSEEEA